MKLTLNKTSETKSVFFLLPLTLVPKTYFNKAKAIYAFNSHKPELDHHVFVLFDTKEIETYYETTLNIQPFTSSFYATLGQISTIPVVGGDIISVEPVDGYLPTHNKFVSDLTTGLKNSYYLGSKYKSFVDKHGNTIWNTIDGAKPVETFVSNPNTLTVNKTGRSTNEPILLVE